MDRVIKIGLYSYLIAASYAVGLAIGITLDAVSQTRLDAVYDQTFGKQCYGDLAVRRECNE